jgi:hypothetical protein
VSEEDYKLIAVCKRVMLGSEFPKPDRAEAAKLNDEWHALKASPAPDPKTKEAYEKEFEKLRVKMEKFRSRMGLPL